MAGNRQRHRTACSDVAHGGERKPSRNEHEFVLQINVSSNKFVPNDKLRPYGFQAGRSISLWNTRLKTVYDQGRLAAADKRLVLAGGCEQRAKYVDFSSEPFLFVCFWEGN